MSTSRSTTASRVASAILFLLFMIAVPASAQEESLRCAGCRTGNELVITLAPGFHQFSGLQAATEVMTPDVALRSLAEGTVDFALTGLPHAELLAEAGLDPARVPGWTSVPVARDPIVVVANDGNGVDGLTREQLAGIFTGRYTRWTEFGGADLPIVPVVLHGAFDCGVTGLFMGGIGAGAETICAQAKCMQSASQLGHFTQATAGAVTFMRGQTFEPIYGKVLAVDGVLPDRQPVLDGSYVLAATFHVVYDRTDGKKAEEFLHYLESDEGAGRLNALMVGMSSGKSLVP